MFVKTVMSALAFNEETREICTVCFNRIKDKNMNISYVLPFNTREVKLKVCSQLCRWFLQYVLGFTQGFLLCNIVLSVCEGHVNNNNGLNSVKELKTVVPFIQFQKADSDIRNNLSTQTVLKKEEGCSDLEDFDCTVSFQDNLCYDDSTDVNEDHIDPDKASSSPKKSTEPVPKKVPIRKAHSCVGANKARFHEQPMVNLNSNMHLAKVADVPKEIQKKRSVIVRTERRSVMLNRRKRLIRTTKAFEMENCVHTSKRKHPKRSVNRQAGEVFQQFDVVDQSRLPFQCEYCLKAFNAKRFLQRHLNRFHPKEIRVSCEMCGDLCKNQKYLKDHMRKEHSLQILEGEELYNCDQCPKSFNSRRGLVLHKEFVHSHENPINCQVCDLTLKNEIYLKRHMKRSHSDSVICDICGAKFKSRLGLSAHLLAHRGVKSFFCEVCGMGFVRKTSLRRHVQQHNEYDYNCESCSSSYKTFGSLSLHMLQIHQRGAYFDNRLKSVEKLGYIVNKEAVKRHLSHQCVTCGEGLVSGVCPAHPTEYALMFKCHRCELTAEHIDDLLAHLKDHTSGMSSSSISVSFGCKMCRKVFPRKLYLNQHMKKHHPGASMSSLSMSTATMSYVCHVCGKHFQQKQYLYVHMKQHLQPRSFACSVCDKKFTYKCNLKNHLTTHSDNKPFQCDICFKLFRRKEVLNSHRLVHNPSLSPFKCHICGKGLSRKQYLNKHYRIMHPETQEQPQQLHVQQLQQQSLL